MKNYSRYSLIISVFCTLLPILLQAQVSQSWISRYDGPGNNVDEARALAVDVHGNVYVTGFSRSSGSFYSEDYATIKYDSTGNQAWLARYNGPGYSSDQANAIAVDTFGNVYVTGVCNDSNTGADFATIKYNSSGNQEWLTPFNGSGVNAPDIAYAIALDNDGNVYVTGYSWAVSTGYENYATVKYNASGIEQWVAYYNGPGNYSDHAYAIAVDNSANVYVTGRSIISGSWNYDYATVKYNASGTEQWVARYNGTQNEVDEAKKIAVDNSGNVYVTGFSVGSGTGRDYVTIKYDSSGTEEWVMRYTEPGNYRDEAYAIALDNSGNVYVTGVSYGVGITGSPDYVTIKYNASGTQQWLARYNGTGNTWDEARAITLDAAGNVYVTGICGSGTNGDYVTVKYNSDGVQQWDIRYNGPGNTHDDARAIAVDNNGNVYITGYSTGSGTDKDYATIKYVQTGASVAEYHVPLFPHHLSLEVFPNPSRKQIRINYDLAAHEKSYLKIYNATGQVVKSTELKTGTNSFLWNRKDNSGNIVQYGIYFIELRSGVQTKKQKVLLLD